MGYTVSFYLVREGSSIARAHMGNEDATHVLDAEARWQILERLRASDPALRREESPDLAADGSELLLAGPGSNPYFWTISERGCDLYWPGEKDSDKLRHVLHRTRPGVAILLKDGFQAFNTEARRPLDWPQDWNTLLSGCAPTSP